MASIIMQLMLNLSAKIIVAILAIVLCYAPCALSSTKM